MIVHRLSTLENCDSINVLERREFQIKGKFNEFINTNYQFKVNTIKFK